MSTQTRSDNPTAILAADIANIPNDLTALPQWVIAGPDKIPVNPSTGRRASVTSPESWTTFAVAVAAAATRPGWLPGLVLTEAAGFVCIDLDDCRNSATGDLEPWAAATAARFRDVAYIEASRSGTGLHLFLKGTLPPGVRRRGRTEVYADKRHILVTGRALSVAPLTDCTDILAAWHAETFPAKPEPATRPPVSSAPSADDQTLIDVMLNARNGHKSRALWDGDISRYPSASEADAALVAILCFYSQDDDQVCRLFERSGLCRPKWLGVEGYRVRTLANARRKQSDSYDPERGRSPALVPIVRTDNHTGHPVAAATLATDHPEAAGSCAVQLAAALSRMAEVMAENRQLRQDRDAETPALAAENERLRATLDRVRQERDEALALNRGLMSTITNPHVPADQKAVICRVALELGHQHRAGKAVAPDTYVLEPRRISNDWRPKPQPGEPIAAANARDGSTPIASRATAVRAIKFLEENQIVPIERRAARRTVTERDPATGATRERALPDVETLVRFDGDASALLLAVGQWQPTEPKIRKTPTAPQACPDCGGLHATRVDRTCTGCGGIQTTIVPAPTATDPTPQPSGRQIVSPKNAPTAPSVATALYGRQIVVPKDAPPAGSIAATWLTGGALSPATAPMFAAPSAPGVPGRDRWTE